MPAKILFIGPMGAGKTTAIAAVSDVAPIATDVLNTDIAQCDKPLCQDRHPFISLPWLQLFSGYGGQVYFPSWVAKQFAVISQSLA